MVRKDKSKVGHPKVWIVWDTEYAEGFAYQQIRAICTRKWVADIDAEIVRREARNHGRRALIEVIPCLLNHLFGWGMIQRLNRDHPLNPDIGSTEDFEEALKAMG